jgi:hypothetical protein
MNGGDGMRMSGFPDVKVLQAGAPRLLAEWMLRNGYGFDAAMRKCPRADWLVWLADAAGGGDAEPMRVAAAAVRAALPIVPGPQWPLDAVLDTVRGEPRAPQPTVADVAEAIVRLQGPPRRVALAVHALCKAVTSHRGLTVRILAAAVVTAAVAQVEVRHAELGVLSTRDVNAFLEGGHVHAADEAAVTPVPLTMMSVLRQLRALVPAARAALGR